jgi:hypothetical protein
MAKNNNLKDNLVLFKYLLNNLGLRQLDGIREILKRQKEGFDEEGRSYFFSALKGYLIYEFDLETYDENIKSYLDHINKFRNEKINLKYYQYLAILFTEIFLEKLQNKEEFLRDINNYCEENDYKLFEESDLSKLAYWMATGSGKTLIMHINYLQYHKYNTKFLDNIILLTPNQDLSNQHLEELKKSNIPSKLFDGSTALKELIQIIDIHKLTEEKKGQGVSVEVSSFEGNNLVFVDEGHKGFSGEKWKKLREQISKIGFTFEYSATFEEAIGSKKNKLLEEYSKSIIFDYSYRFFYFDGFGKEFTVMNLKETEYNEHKNLILVYNLLSYYQQIKFFGDNENKIQDFLFDKPLWAFIGNTVTGQKSNPQKNIVSDLEYILNFFNKFLNERDNFIEIIDNILDNKTGLIGKDGELNSDNLFAYIKSKKLNKENIYEDILSLVFNAKVNQRLELNVIEGSQGEIALKVANSETFFGLIYIGDTSSFKKKIEEEGELLIRDHKFSDSLFDNINLNTSPLNILIGSKKFIEGWNSYRVSSMGLLNMGSSKGSQIIQLFGRGVRLRGYKNLMKRSESLISEAKLEKSEVPKDIAVLETLNIFGIKADYVKTFQEQLQKQGINQTVSMELKVEKNHDFLKKNLLTMRLKENAQFNETLILEFDGKLNSINIDLKPKISSFSSHSDSGLESERDEIEFPLEDYLNFVDLDNIYFNLYDFKQQKGFFNLYFNKDILKSILEEKNYKIFIDKSKKSKNFSDIKFAEKLCVRILKTYMKNFYNMYKRKWASDKLEYAVLDEQNENFQDYAITIDKREKLVLKNIKELIETTNTFYEEDNKELPSIFFDKHLYQPLIVFNRKITTTPTGLNEGEVKFIKDIRKFFSEQKENPKLNGYEFFIFRNLSKKGIGIFTETNNFYPDFILWAINENVQKIAFIDPKGLVHGIDEKIAKMNLNSILKYIEQKLGRVDVELFSFILSTSSYEDIKRAYSLEKDEFESRNVLFQEESDYIEKLIFKIL